MKKKCPICGKEFIAHRSSKIYCGYDCQMKAMNLHKRLAREAAKQTRICQVCGVEFKPKVGRQYTCSPECSAELGRRRVREKEQYKEQKEKELVTKAVAQAEKKPVKTAADWEREARDCGVNYGLYRGLIALGKTREEIKAQYGRSETAHAHAGQSTRRAGRAMGVKLT